MSMELKEGMYVRTTKGIGKIEQVIDTDDKYRYVIDISKIYIFNDDDILSEPSFDVIDLVREGDYINGNKVCLITDENIYTQDEQIIYAKDSLRIKSILTREQYESMSYIVED